MLRLDLLVEHPKSYIFEERQSLSHIIYFYLLVNNVNEKLRMILRTIQNLREARALLGRVLKLIKLHKFPYKVPKHNLVNLPSLEFLQLFDDLSRLLLLLDCCLNLLVYDSIASLFDENILYSIRIQNVLVLSFRWEVNNFFTWFRFPEIGEEHLKESLVDVVDLSFRQIWNLKRIYFFFWFLILVHYDSIGHVVENIPLFFKQALDFLQLKKVDLGASLDIVADKVNVENVTWQVFSVISQQIFVESIDYPAWS